MTPSHNIPDIRAVLLSLWRAKLYKKLLLPGIVVCGDQSSGKSSVLEAISSLKFPTGDSMCTKFVTRVEMEYSDETFMQAAIEPSPHRSPEEQADLCAWGSDQMEVDLSRFGDLVVAAGTKMGTDNQEGFMRDTLIVQVRGPRLPFFTFVDLPGLIRSTREHQDESDIKHIEDLVQEYMSNERMIILAVISASNDLENQGVLLHAVHCDPEGRRTLGVITKPDSCHDRPSIEVQALKYLKGEGTSKYQWQNGWHVLKNRSALQTDMTFDGRNQAEEKFLAKTPWDQIPPERKGGRQLAIRLEEILFKAFVRLTPALIDDISGQIQQWQCEIDGLASQVPGVTDPWEDLKERVDQVQAILLQRITSARRDTFSRKLEDITVDFFETIYKCGNCYEFDTGSLVVEPRKPKSRATLKSEWESLTPRPVQELYQISLEIVGKTDANAGQLTESMYEQIYQNLISHWPRLFSQYVEKIRDLLESHLGDVCKQIFPSQILEEVHSSLVAPQADKFVAGLSSKIITISQTPTPNGTLMADAMDKAWQLQFDQTVSERVTAAFKGNAKTFDASNSTRRECNHVLGQVTKDACDPRMFTARQALAVAQLMYIDQVDEIKPIWNSAPILNELKTFIAGFANKVMSQIGKDRAREIYGGADSDSAQVMEIEQEITNYETCLAELQALQASFDHDA